jgi:hypothetical protein
MAKKNKKQNKTVKKKDEYCMPVPLVSLCSTCQREKV